MLFTYKYVSRNKVQQHSTDTHTCRRRPDTADILHVFCGHLCRRHHPVATAAGYGPVPFALCQIRFRLTLLLVLALMF